jgi:hypothetical protein
MGRNGPSRHGLRGAGAAGAQHPAAHERRTAAVPSTAVASERTLGIAERNRFQLSLTTNKARPALPRPALPAPDGHELVVCCRLNAACCVLCILNVA